MSIGVRRSRSAAAPFALALALAGCGNGGSGTEPAAGVGVVVEKVPAGALKRAGIEVDDRLLAWRLRDGSAGGLLESPFDLWPVEHERAARGTVELRVRTAGEERWVSAPPGRWEIEARPSLSVGELELYRRGRDAFDRADPEEGEGLYRRLADLVGEERARERIWVLAELSMRRPGPRGESAIAEAIELVESGGDASRAALLHARRGQRLDRAGRFEEAIDAYRRALELRREAGQEVAAALTLAEMGRIEGRRGNPAEEERLHRQALDVLDRTVPESLEVSRVLRGLARARATQDDVADAMAHAGRSLEIAARLAPGGFDHEAALMIHGIFHWLQEDWERAEARLSEALEIVEALDPRHQDVSNTLHNLGLVASYRGDQAEAGDYLVRALEAAPDGDPIQRTKILNSLGTFAMARHDLRAARRWFHQVLEIRERLTPDSLNVATPLINLGEVARLDGSLDEAERLFERVLELQRRFIPESRDPAMTLLNLAMVSQEKGDLEKAEERALEALGIVRPRFPGVLLEASLRHTLGVVRHEAGRSAEGELELRRSIDLFERLAPGTTAGAVAVYDLGRVQRDSGRIEEAVDTFLRAIGILDRQVRRLGGGDVVRSRFRGHLLHVYRDGIELLMDLGRREEAFHLLERSQARSLLALLAESGVDFDRGLPPDLRAQWTELSIEYDRLTEELAGLSSETDSHRVADVAHRLDQLRLSREDLRGRVGGVRRGVLAEDERKTLDLEGALGALPDDMVALSYSVAAERSWSFILGPGHAFRVVDLGVGAAELQDLVDRLLLLIERPGFGGESYRPLAVELYDHLVAPAEEEIERARRILLLPDGPLHLLPFAALFRESTGGGGTHLVEWRPLQLAASLTVFDALRARPAPPLERGPVVAFVEPRGERSAESAEGAAARDRLAPLPHARREAEGLRRLYGERALLYVGPEATEGRAKDLEGNERILHFAAHGILDRISPLDSGLLLRPSRRESGMRDNGLLQAWEIFDSLRTSADLVTLSACESASGLSVAGEGLMSLTRAFQFAGARSVLASLWQVSDRSTAILMERFYARLAEGAPRDEALREAQLDLLRGEAGAAEAAGLPGFFNRLLGRATNGPDYRHPYYWAAFQLYGPGQ